MPLGPMQHAVPHLPPAGVLWLRAAVPCPIWTPQRGPALLFPSPLILSGSCPSRSDCWIGTLSLPVALPLAWLLSSSSWPVFPDKLSSCGKGHDLPQRPSPLLVTRPPGLSLRSSGCVTLAPPAGTPPLPASWPGCDSAPWALKDPGGDSSHVQHHPHPGCTLLLHSAVALRALPGTKGVREAPRPCGSHCLSPTARGPDAVGWLA